MINYHIVVALGILIALLGFGKIPISSTPSKNQEYLKRYGRVLRVCGIILILVGLFLAISTLFVR